jgi:hypothetical protein
MPLDPTTAVSWIPDLPWNPPTRKFMHASTHSCYSFVDFEPLLRLETGFPVSATIVTTATSVTTATFSTAGPRLIVAVVGTHAGSIASAPLTITWNGGIPSGATGWTKVASQYTTGSFPNFGGGEVWFAKAFSALTTKSVTVTKSGATDQNATVISVFSFINASSSVGNTGSRDGSGGTITLNAPVTAAASGSFIAGVAVEDSTTALTANATSTDVTQASNASAGGRVGSFYLTAKTTVTGTAYTPGYTQTSATVAMTLGAEIKQGSLTFDPFIGFPYEQSEPFARPTRFYIAECPSFFWGVFTPPPPPPFNPSAGFPYEQSVDFARGNKIHVSQHPTFFWENFTPVVWNPSTMGFPYEQSESFARAAPRLNTALQRAFWLDRIQPLLAVPTLVQHVSSTANPPTIGITGNNFKFWLPNAVGAGNCLILGISYKRSAGRTVAVSDNNGNTWPGSPTVTDTDGTNTTSAIYVLPNANPGVTRVNVTFDASLIPFQYTISEFYNVDTVSPVNGTVSSHTTTSPNISTGSFTPGNNNAIGGNLIWSYFCDNESVTNNSATNFAPGTGFTLLSADICEANQIGVPTGAQYSIQQASASINPSMTITHSTSGEGYNALAVALKAAIAGTAPNPQGIRILKIAHGTNGAPPTTWPLHFPSAGNLLVVIVCQSEIITITSVTDSNGNSYTKYEPATDEPQFWVAANATTSSDLKITINSSGTPQNSSVLMYDIIGADSNPKDGQADLSGGGISAGSNTISDAPSLTPVSQGLTIASVSFGTGPSDGFASGAPARAIFDYVSYTGETDSDRMDNADGRAHLYNTDLTAEHWNWHVTHTGGTTAGAFAVHFKSAFELNPFWEPDYPDIIPTKKIVPIAVLAPNFFWFETTPNTVTFDPSTGFPFEQNVDFARANPRVTEYPYVTQILRPDNEVRNTPVNWLPDYPDFARVKPPTNLIPSYFACPLGTLYLVNTPFQGIVITSAAVGSPHLNFSNPFDVEANRLLVLQISSIAFNGTDAIAPFSVASTGLTWNLALRKPWTTGPANSGVAEIWYAYTNAAQTILDLTVIPNTGTISGNATLYIFGNAKPYLGAIGYKENNTGASVLPDSFVQAHYRSIVIGQVLVNEDGASLSVRADNIRDSEGRDGTSFSGFSAHDSMGQIWQPGIFTIGSNVAKTHVLATSIEILDTSFVQPVSGWEPTFPDVVPYKNNLQTANYPSFFWSNFTPAPASLNPANGFPYEQSVDFARKAAKTAEGFVAQTLLPDIYIRNFNLSWLPTYPDRVPAASRVIEYSYIALVERTNADVTNFNISWLPDYPDFIRAYKPVNEGGETLNTLALSNLPIPNTSWSPEFPDFAKGVPVISYRFDSTFFNSTIIAPSTVPALSWQAEFPDYIYRKKVIVPPELFECPLWIVPGDRISAYQPGMMSVGGIINRSTIFTTLSPSGGDDTSAIQTAINNCPTGQVVKLNAGTFIVNGDGGLSLNKAITLRGSGLGVTILKKTNGALSDVDSPGPNASPLIIVGPARFGTDEDNTTSKNLTVDGKKGSDSITVSSTTGYAAGQFVLVDADEYDNASWLALPTRSGVDTSQISNQSYIWATDRTVYKRTRTQGTGTATFTNGSATVTGVGTKFVGFNGLQISADNGTTWYSITGTASNTSLTISPVFAQSTASGVNFQVSDPQDDPYPDSLVWFSRSGRATAEIKEIASISGNIIKFTTPLHTDYPVSKQSQVTRYTASSAIHVKNAGVEDLTCTGGSNGGVRFENAAYSWAQNVEVTVWRDEGFCFNRSFRVEVRQCYVHQAAFPSPGGGAYAFSFAFAGSDCLIEDNIVDGTNKVIVSRCAGAGSVVSYNYMDDGFIIYDQTFMECGVNGSHMVGAHHMLFEGNYSFNADADNTHGNAVQHVYFRNHLSGYVRNHGLTVANNLRAGGLNYGGWWHSFVGNVMGRSGAMSGWIYEQLGTNPDPDPYGGNPPIWKFGYQSGQWDQHADPTVLSTVQRDGNFDYQTNTQRWHGIGGTVGKGTTKNLPDSLYLTSKPSFFGSNTWPWVDPAGGTKTYILPAKARFDVITDTFSALDKGLFPDITKRRNITTYDYPSFFWSGFTPSAIPPLNPANGFPYPEYPDFAYAADRALNEGGSVQNENPIATPPAPLGSWYPDFADFAKGSPRAAEFQAFTIGRVPAELVAYNISWLPDYPDFARKSARTIEYPAFVIGLRSQQEVMNFNISWLPDYPDFAKVKTYPADTKAVFHTPQNLSGPAPLESWSPDYPDFAKSSVRTVEYLSSFFVLRNQSDVTPFNLSWIPDYPDFARKLPVPVNVGGTVNNILPLANPPAPLGSWYPDYPEFARTFARTVEYPYFTTANRSQADVINFNLAWLPDYPDFARGLSYPVREGGEVFNALPISNAPAPFGSWYPDFPDFAKSALRVVEFPSFSIGLRNPEEVRNFNIGWLPEYPDFIWKKFIDRERPGIYYTAQDKVPAPPDSWLPTFPDWVIPKIKVTYLDAFLPTYMAPSFFYAPIEPAAFRPYALSWLPEYPDFARAKPVPVRTGITSQILLSASELRASFISWLPDYPDFARKLPVPTPFTEFIDVPRQLHKPPKVYKDMLNVTKITVKSFDLDYLDIFWTISSVTGKGDSKTHPIFDFEFYVLRSEAAMGPYTQIAGPLRDQYYLRDVQVALRHKWREFFYKIKVVHKPTGYSKEFGPSSFASPDRDLIATEIIRQEDKLFREFIGRKCYLFPARTFGPVCTCFDNVLKQRTRSQHLVCFDTGWLGGYMNPVECYIQIDPVTKAAQSKLPRETMENDTHARMIAFPPVNPGDIIVESENRRWRVMSVPSTQRLRAIVHQELVLHEVPKGDIIYSLPINVDLKTLETSAPRNFNFSPNIEDDSEYEDIFAIFGNPKGTIK